MSLPLHLCQVLEEEYVALYGDLPETLTWQLVPDHIGRPERLAVRLRGEDALARHLRSHGLAAVLDREGDALLASLVDGLNAVLTSGPLYDKARFAPVALSPRLRRLTTLEIEGDELQHVNRLLLEAAFPDDITPIHEARTAAVHRAIHRRASRPDDPAPRTALCFSGGGIRSATFGLGVVQALAHLRLLDRFDYLSTVSGGGYLGGWLSAWVHRHPSGIEGVMADVTAPAGDLHSEPGPIRHFRQNSSDLIPALGAMSADTSAAFGRERPMKTTATIRHAKPIPCSSVSTPGTAGGACRTAIPIRGRVRTASRNGRTTSQFSTRLRT